MNSPRLKARLLSHCPFLSAIKMGNHVMLAFHTEVGDALKRVCGCSYYFARVAQIVRRQIFQGNYCFLWDFRRCQHPMFSFSFSEVP